MKYEFGLVNYFLHELGNNLINDDSAIINENKMFDTKLSDKDRIVREIDKIKDKSDKYNNYLDVDNNNIKEIIICIDLLLGIEISFKTAFILVASKILEDEKFSEMLNINTDDYDTNMKEADKLLKKIIKKHLKELCT